MKKIGLVTCFLDNYGACLQAYALQQSIEDAGFECEIVNYVEPYGYPHRNSLKGKIKYLPFVRGVYSLMSKEYRNRYIEERKFDKFRAHYLKIAKKRYETTQEIMGNPPIYDAYVCGSDQIWNPLFYKRNNPVYFLDFVPDGKKRIAYAPSIGISAIPVKYADDFKRLVERMHCISVRENEGKRIIEELTDKSATVVLDPTLLKDGTYWAEIASPINYNEKFIFCYIFGDRPYMHNVLKKIQEDLNVDVLYTNVTTWGEQIPHGKKISEVGPREFLWLIRNAEMVITDSFHATAFSINFNTPFYTLLRNENREKNSMNSRIYSILEMAHLSDRLLEDYVEGEKYSYGVEFEVANQILSELRHKDIEFLINAINN